MKTTIPQGFILERELRELYGTHDDAELARLLGVDVATIERAAKVMRLGKDKAHYKGRPMPRWDEVDTAYLRDHYATEDNLTLAKHLDRTVKAVVARAHKEGLKKDPERLQEMGRVNVAIRYGRKYAGPFKSR